MPLTRQTFGAEMQWLHNHRY